MPMADQVRRAVAWVYRNARSFGGDPERIYVSGHSSGAHLAGVVAHHRLAAATSICPRDIVKGGLCSQRHVRPEAGAALGAQQLRQVHRRDGAGAQRAAPPRPAQRAGHRQPRHAPSRRSSSARRAISAAALEAAGKPMKLLVGEDYNHFEIIETLGSPLRPLAARRSSR